MATAQRKTAAKGANLERALRAFLRAIPIDHLDERLTALETWVTGLEKELRRSGGRVGRAVADTGPTDVLPGEPVPAPPGARTFPCRRSRRHGANGPGSHLE
jgi:hypothetical protein